MSLNISDLLGHKKLERVEVEEAKKSTNLHIYYRSHSGYGIADTVNLEGTIATLHLVHVYEPPRTRPKRPRGLIVDKPIQFALADASKKIPKNIDTVIMGEEYWAIHGLFIEKEEKLYLQIGDKPWEILLETDNPQKLHQIFENMIDQGMQVSIKVGGVTIKQKPEPWPPQKLNVIEIEYMKRGSGANYVTEKI